MEIYIDKDGEKIEILDNCGGIPQDIAEEYAFYFGRPNKNEKYEYRIGEFGIGMKRALFHLCEAFLIESNPEDGDRYVIDVDIEEWKEDDEEWNFTGEVVSESDGRVELDETGTRIVMDPVKQEHVDKFSSERFKNNLKEKLRSEFSQILEKGFQIIMNNEAIAYSATELLQSDQLQPAYMEESYDIDGSSVQVTLQAGLGESNPNDAGWYVFCNGRLVVEADRTEKTVWTGEPIPKYHNQFSRFRGLINFKSEDLGVLPWNTTKTDINSDSRLYQWSQNKMEEISRPVIDFLNDVKSQKDELENPEEQTAALEQTMKDADVVESKEATPDEGEDQEFSAPDPDEVEKPDILSYIQYRKEEEKIEEMKKELGVETNQEVGEKTFDFYYETRL